MNTLTTKRDRGQSLVEFALTLGILILFILVIVDLGRVVYAYSSLHNAAREGARYGAIHPTSYTQIEAATRKLTAGLNQSLLSFSLTYPNTAVVRVTLQYQFTPATPILQLIRFGSGTITLRSQATMRIEQ